MSVPSQELKLQEERESRHNANFQTALEAARTTGQFIVILEAERGPVVELSEEQINTIAQLLIDNKLTSLQLNWKLVTGAKKIQHLTKLAQALRQNTSVIELDLSANPIQDDGVIVLAKALEHNTTLKKLKLCNTHMGNAGATALAKMLEENRSITRLNVAHNEIGDAGAIALARALEHNTSLASLCFFANKIRVRGIEEFAKVLEKNIYLTLLDLRYNFMGDAGAIALARVVKRNTPLTSLLLGNTGINVMGAIEFAIALKKNTRLTRLDFSGNYIDKDCVIELADALKKHPTLTSLDLSTNKIGDLKALSEALVENTALKELDLRWNDIDDRAVAGLEEVLKRNATLTSLNLSFNYCLTEAARTALIEALRPNTALTQLDGGDDNLVWWRKHKDRCAAAEAARAASTNDLMTDPAKAEQAATHCSENKSQGGPRATG